MTGAVAGLGVLLMLSVCLNAYLFLCLCAAKANSETAASIREMG